MIYDVVVVGAGPSGSAVARKVAEKGYRTLLCEEHEFVGKPCHCTGKLTAHAFREFNLPRETILNSVGAAVFHSPKGTKLSIRGRGADSYVVDRELLDLRLAEMACDSGSELSTQTRVHDLHRDPDGIVTLDAKRMNTHLKVKSRLIVDAEGARPTLLNRLGLRVKSELLVGLQYEMDNVCLVSPDCVELYFGSDLAPGFFAWIVPVSEDKARVGLCIRKNKADQTVQYFLERFVRNLICSGRIRQRRILRTYAGVEPIGEPLTPSYTDSLLIVGDSAGQVKSTSGGGVYFGLKAAEIAAETAAECLGRNDVSSRSLARYESRWKKAIGRELRVTSLMRRVLDGLADDETDEIFQLMSEEDIREIIERYGDTAYQSRLLRPLLPVFLRKGAKPDRIVLLGKILSSGLLSLIS
jgi:digeranylgeranylglycerophospholipid reductase